MHYGARIAGSISSSTSINHTACKANHGSATAITGGGTRTDGQTTTCAVTNNNVTPPQIASAVILCVN